LSALDLLVFRFSNPNHKNVFWLNSEP